MRRLFVFAAFALLLASASGADARRSASAAAASAAASASVAQSVLDSAAAEIRAQLSLESDLNNADRVNSGEVAGVFSDSELAAVLSRAESSAAAGAGERVEADAFAFLADSESPLPASSAPRESLRSILASTASPVSSDVEADLDTIAAEIGGLLPTPADQARSKLNRKINKNKNKTAKRANRRSAYAPSARQQQLISRLDGYRVSRGHSGAGGASLMETGSRQLPVWGYSAPSAYVAPAIAGAVAVPSPFQGQVATNQNALFSALGLIAPAAPAAAAAVPATNAAGVSVLLNAIKRVQEEQETAALARQLSALLASQQAVAASAAVPAVVANPFALQSLYGNLGVPRLMPGQTGVSPSYPSFIPTDQASVTNEQDQPNPFADHMP